MAGKGDKRRPGPAAYIANYERIFGSKEEDLDTSDVEAFHIKNARHLKTQDLEFKEKLAEEKRKRDQELFDRLDREVEEENNETCDDR